ncbi:LytTR family DNA-binding domain-containing protein [Paenibacillus sp. PAMC21692]|uniref:LytTR family DNA-binding domain-containing protein n=1 Tax=Paenibacillus sp. PAMC21692 TaxID=2762320 RepID=UPI0021C2AC05|nr:LytTR family DNA-binding domain-containing protein [Paenibacillus sp. PAMC21692]
MEAKSRRRCLYEERNKDISRCSCARAAKGFIRINKSQLVNLLHVKEIIPWFNSRYMLRMDNGAELEVSKMFSKKLRHTLNL